VARLATAQGGAVSREQLRGLGVSNDAIDYGVRLGRLHCVFRGVYALGHEALTPKGRLTAAVLACGPEAAISHRSAAIWWGFWRGPQPQGVEVTVPGRSRKGQRGLDLHLVRGLDPRDRTMRHGVPITKPARTFLDLAETVPLWRLRLAIDEGDRRGLFDPDAVHRLLRRSPGRKGLKPLGLLLGNLRDEPLIRSELELLFAELCDAHDLPRPQTNVEVMGHEVDALWPAQRVIVELDSRAFHLNGAAFERDRRRDAILLAAGYRVMRVTHRQLREEPAAVARRLLSLLNLP
jgi:Protein of unknown function (DUF559)